MTLPAGIELIARGSPLFAVLRLLYAPVKIEGYPAGVLLLVRVSFCTVTFILVPGPNVIVWPAVDPQALFWTMYSLGQLTFASPYCCVIVPEPLGVMQLAVPPEPPVPVPPVSTGSTLPMQTLNWPRVVAVLPAETWICMSTGVPSVPVLVQGLVVPAQLGQVTSAKQT